MGKFKSIICIALAVLLAASCLAGCTEKEEFDVKKIVLSDEQVYDIGSEINELIDSRIFNGAVSVTLNENEIFKRYVGMANKQSDPVTEDCQYLISSATMVFTTIAVSQLEEDGALSVNDTLGKYFDADKYTYLVDVTVGDLLDKSVSLGNYSSEMNRDQNVRNELVKKIRSKKRKSREQIKEMIEEHILGKGVVSSDSQNSNYYILGRIIEKASGMSYDKYLQKNIIDKLGLKNTGFVSRDQKAVGYNLETKNWIRQIDNELTYSFEYLFSSFGVISTLDDMNTFYKAVLDKQLCKTDIVKKALRRGSGFGYGFETDGKLLYIRAGANLHRVYLCVNPETEEIVNVLTCTVGDTGLARFGKEIYSKVNSRVNGIILENAD